MKKILSILFFISYGAGILPIPSYAAHIKVNAVKSSAHHKMNKGCDEKKIRCCKHKSSKKTEDKSDCDGNCNHCTCHVTAINIAMCIAEETNVLNPTVIDKKINCLSQSDVTSGFYSIWRPPKIS